MTWVCIVPDRPCGFGNAHRNGTCGWKSDTPPAEPLTLDELKTINGALNWIIDFPIRKDDAEFRRVQAKVLALVEAGDG